MTPLLMASGEFERRLSMARIAGKPLEYTPRGVEHFAGMAIDPQAITHDRSSDHNAKELFIRSGRTAIISVDGPIFFAASFYACFFGGMSNPMIVRALHHAAEDESIDRIVMDYHCPGGDVPGIDDLITAINTAKASKPVIAMVHDMAASAAYWMASQCSRVVASPSSTIGAIGAISVYYDDSQWADKHGVRPVVITDAPHKSMGHHGVPIDEQMIEREMKLLTDMSQGFRDAVSEARGIDADELKAMGGSMHYAPDALSRGLCDEIRSTAEFYQAVEAGEYDSYGPDGIAGSGSSNEPSMQAATINNSKNNTTASGRVVAQHTEMKAMNVDETIESMTDEEKEEMRSKLAQTDEGESTEEGTADASSEGENTETEEEGNAGATSTDGEEEQASSKMTVAKAEAILKPHKLPEAMSNKIVLAAVKANMSAVELLSTAMAEINTPQSRDDQALEHEAQGASAAIGGGAGSGTGGSGGSAKARFEQAVATKITANPGMSRSQAFRAVSIEQPALAKAYDQEAS